MRCLWLATAHNQVIYCCIKGYDYIIHHILKFIIYHEIVTIIKIYLLFLWLVLCLLFSKELLEIYECLATFQMLSPAVETSLATRAFLRMEHVSFKLILLEELVPDAFVCMFMSTTASIVVFLIDLDCFTSLIKRVLYSEPLQ